MRRTYWWILAIALVAAGPAGAATIGTCTDGIRTATDFRLAPGGVISDPVPGFVCGPTFQSLVRIQDTNAAVGVGAASVGASAGAGALSAEDPGNSNALASASVWIEFMLKTVTPGTAFGLLPITYEAILTTLDFSVDATGNSFTSGSARAFMNVWELTSGGMVEAGGVPTAHRNGVAASTVVGAIVPIFADSVLVKPDTPYAIELHVSSFASVAASGGAMGERGSASAEFSAAISLANLIPTPFSESDRYAIEIAIANDPSAQLPGADVFPTIDSPLSLVTIPLPASFWLLGSAFGLLARAVRNRKHT